MPRSSHMPQRHETRSSEAPWFTARQTFTTTYAGEQIAIKAGERLHPSHELPHRHPEKFRRDTPERSRITPKATVAAAAVAGAAAGKRDDTLVVPHPPWSLTVGPAPGLLAAGDVELLRSTSPITVKITAEVRDQISTHAEAVPYGYETGGLLIARRSRDDDTVRLAEAWGPGPGARLHRDRMALDWEREHRKARALTDQTDRQLIAAGAWHVHPAHCLGEPTDVDLRMFAAAMADASATVWPLRHYVAIIATSVGRSRGPDISAWVVRPRRFSGDLICERAELR